MLILEKVSLTPSLTNLGTKLERNKSLVFIEKVFDFLLQHIKNGSKNINKTTEISEIHILAYRYIKGKE